MTRAPRRPGSEPSPLSVNTDSLPPHLHRVARCLLTHRTQNDIADELGLSPHTVHGYTRDIYRHLNVRGRIGLMAHVLQQLKRRRERRG